MAGITTSFVAQWSNYRESTASGSWSTDLTASLLTLTTNALSTSKADEPANPEMAEWTTLRDQEDVDVRVRWRVADHAPTFIGLTRGFGVWARLPDPPFTPNGDGNNPKPMYALRWRADSLLLEAGYLSDTIGNSPLDEYDMGTSPTIETWYWLRFKVTETGSGSLLRGKAWADGEPEPSAWMVENTVVSGNQRYVAPGGRVAVSNQGGGGSSATHEMTYEVNYAQEGAIGGDRVRSAVSLTVGDILQSVSSPQFELSAREAFFEGAVLVEGYLHTFAEALSPDSVTHRWYPLSVPTQPGLREYAASTKLGRMTRAYPEPFVARAIDLVGTDTMTAQQVLEQLFARWASEFDWFTYKSVPDLRHRVASADAPGDYTAGVGELTLPAIVMRQEEPNRRTMRQILDRVLSLFPGTALVQDSEGDIALRPTYGPDAPTTPDVTLSTDDIVSTSDGVPDTQRVYNQARVTSDGGDFEEDVALTTSLYGLIADGPEAEEALGPDGENVLPTAREEVTVKAWHAFDVLAAGDTIDVEYTIRLYALYYGSDPTMTNPPSDVTLETTETATITLTLGADATVVTVSDTVGEFLGGGGIDPSADVTFEANRESGIKIGYTTATSYGSVRHFSGTSWFRFAWVVEVDTTGLGYVEATETVIGKFGYDLTEDEVLSTDGTSNALAVSQATYGERELPLSSDLFPLTLEQALRIAEGAVLHYINPRTIYQVEQAWWRAFPVKPDHIGRIVEMPTTEQGFVQARSYDDSFEDPDAPQVASTFEVVLTEAAFTTAGLLAFDDGTLMAFNDGTLVETE